MPKIERCIVRIVVAGLLIAVVWFALTFTIPSHATGHNRMPGVALGQPDLYRAEIGLALLYAGLLLLMALFYGVLRGTLPIEISQQGAKSATEQPVRLMSPSMSSMRQLRDFNAI